MNFEKALIRLGIGGIQPTRTKDLVDEQKLAYARNMRIYKLGELRCRPGYGASALFSSDAPTAIHTLRRFNDTLLGSYSFLIGAGSVLYYATEGGSLTSKITGLSGKSLSTVFIRPSQGAKAYAYIADSNKMSLITPAGTAYDWSILGLNVPPSATLSQSAYKVIDLFDSISGWANTGTAGALSKVDYRIDFTIPTGGIIYDSGSTGWANIIPTTLDANFQVGAMLTYNPGGGTEEKAKIHFLSQASGSTTIASVRYDLGSTGLATLLLTTPTDNLVQNSTLKITTSGTDYYLRVIEVLPSTNNLPSVRVKTTATHAAGDTVVGVRSYRAHLQNNHVATETVRTSYCTFTNSTGTGIQTAGSLSLDLTKSDTLGTRPFTDDDIIHLSVMLSNPALLTELQIKLDIDSTTNDGTKNYFYYAVQPSAFSTSSTTLTATQVDIQRQTIIGYQVPYDYSPYHGGDYYSGAYNDSPGQIDYNLTSPSGAYTEPVYGTTSNPSGVSDASSGASQWTELHLKLSDFKRIGSDLSRGWKDVKALIVQVVSTGSLDVALDSWFIEGGYNPGNETVGNIAIPYNYVVVCRDKNTGDRSLPSPPLREGLTLTHNAVTLSFSENSNPRVTDYDIYRFGGTLSEWIYLGTSPATGSGTVTFFDNFQDQDIAANPALSREDYPVFPMLDLPRSGTATIKGNILEITGGDSANVLWAAGVRVLVKNSSNETYVCGLYSRPTSTSVMELDASPGYTGTVSWSISEPVLLSQPLAAVWGPYGGGIDNPYIFACGATYQAGTLFWTNSGRPGSSSLRNQLEITSPQEPLIGGCIYDGQAFCWSRRRMFRIFPSGEGQFQAQEVANSKGLAARNCLAVGQTIFFLGDDGIYATTGGQPYSITDRDLYNLFPHDGALGEEVNGIYPPDYTQRDLFNLEFKNDFLYFTYKATDSNFYTLVFDVSRLTTGLAANPEDAGGWISVDDYSPGARVFYNEDPDNDDRSRLLIATSTGKVYLPSATQDAGSNIPYAFETRHLGAQNPNDYKRWLTLNLEAELLSTTASVYTVSDLGSPSLATTLTGTSRNSLEVPLNGGISSRYLGVRVTGSSSASVSPRFYSLVCNYDPQINAVDQAWTAPDDLGDLGAKWFQGIEIEADTGGVDKQYQILYDNDQVGPTITINHNGQYARGYSFSTPFIAHTVRLKPLTTGEVKIITLKWIYEPEPDLVTVWQPQPTTHDFPGWQHLRGGYLALRSTTIVTLQITADALRTTTYNIPSTNGALGKYYFPIFAKGKVFSYKLSSSVGFRVYQRDLELHVKPWGSGESYVIVKPYGKPSRINGGAII